MWLQKDAEVSRVVVGYDEGLTKRRMSAAKSIHLARWLRSCNEASGFLVEDRQSAEQRSRCTEPIKETWGSIDTCVSSPFMSFIPLAEGMNSCRIRYLKSPLSYGATP